MEHYTFKTARELKIPEEARDGLVQVMLDLRSGALPWDRDYMGPGYRGEGNPQGFNMSLFNRHGEGPSCISGWLCRRGQFDSCGLYRNNLRFLEFPSEGGLPVDAHGGLNTIGPQEAAMAIQVYLETGTRRPWADARVAAAREIDHAPQQ